MQVPLSRDNFVAAFFSSTGHPARGGTPRLGRRMAPTLELDGLNELRAALLEERQIILASVRKLRQTRRQKGTFVLGDGSEAGPRFCAVQQQIDVVETVIATLTKSQT